MCETARAQEHLPYGKAQIVRIASEYFDAHADERVSLADLAKVAAASARSLNYAFQDLVGMSPMRYFRMKRLGRARSKLVQASPQRGAVKQAALSAGYTHLGRFSAEYHELFGELPSVTLADR
jgi:AraC family ethanolamine operon transcriptional activator